MVSWSASSKFRLSGSWLAKTRKDQEMGGVLELEMQVYENNMKCIIERCQNALKIAMRAPEAQ
jgi:hypothetical protein